MHYDTPGTPVTRAAKVPRSQPQRLKSTLRNKRRAARAVGRRSASGLGEAPVGARRPTLQHDPDQAGSLVTQPVLPEAVFLAARLSPRSHRAKGGLTGRRWRDRHSPTLDPGGYSLGDWRLSKNPG